MTQGRSYSAKEHRLSEDEWVCSCLNKLYQNTGVGADLLKLNHRVFPSVVDSVQYVEALTSNVFGDRAQREVSMVKQGHKERPVQQGTSPYKKRKRHQECMCTEKRSCVQTE